MKNYGLCIWNSNNYGSNLTNLCLFNLIKSYGHNPLVIISKSNIEADYRNFIDLNYPTMKIENNDMINKYLDGLIVGSDCTFSFSYEDCVKNKSHKFLLENINIPKFSLSSSVVPPRKISRYTKYRVKQALEKFQFISIRESDSIKYLTNFFGVKRIIYDTLDPVFLIGKKFLSELSQKSNLKYSDYNVVYALTENDIVKTEIENYKDKKIHIIQNPDNLKTDGVPDKMFKYYDFMNIYDFVYTIANCDRVFTDSYHGLVLSLIFEKPVKYIYRYTKERFTSLEKIIKNTSRDIKQEDYKDITPLLLKRIQHDKSLIEDILK